MVRSVFRDPPPPPYFNVDVEKRSWNLPGSARKYRKSVDRRSLNIDIGGKGGPNVLIFVWRSAVDSARVGRRSLLATFLPSPV